MNHQATAGFQAGGRSAAIRIPPLSLLSMVRQSLSKHDQRLRLDSAPALTFSHTLNPNVVPNLLFRHTAANLAVVPRHPNIRSSGPRMDKVPVSVIDAPCNPGPRAAAQLLR
jgi:hypothetical protein